MNRQNQRADSADRFAGSRSSRLSLSRARLCGYARCFTCRAFQHGPARSSPLLEGSQSGIRYQLAAALETAGPARLATATAPTLTPLRGCPGLYRPGSGPSLPGSTGRRWVRDLPAGSQPTLPAGMLDRSARSPATSQHRTGQHRTPPPARPVRRSAPFTPPGGYWHAEAPAARSEPSGACPCLTGQSASRLGHDGLPLECPPASMYSKSATSSSRRRERTPDMTSRASPSVAAPVTSETTSSALVMTGACCRASACAFQPQPGRRPRPQTT